MSTPQDHGRPRPAGNRTGAWYVVAVLLIAYTFSFIDRTILALLVAPIKADLDITDTQISLLHGFAFAIFYTIMGLPIGRMADQHSRRWIIASGVFVWSLMTAVCGLAKSFWHLFVARVGVGVGEAALSPAAYSLISDCFEPARLGRALGVYSSGVYVGSGLAFIIGGAVIQLVSDTPTLVVPVLGEVAPWQATFFAVGLPGLLVALLCLTIREPERWRTATSFAHGSETPVPKASFGNTLEFIGGHWRTFASHYLGFALLALTFNAVIAWAPSVLIRKFGWTAGEAGFALGLDLLIFGAAGIVAGGWVSDLLTRRGRTDATILTGVISAAGVIPFFTAACLAPSGFWTALFFAPFMFFSSFAFGAAAAALQVVSPNEMRAQISAIYLFVLNLLGIGLGPTLVALLTDYVFADEARVDMSLLIVGLVAAMGGGLVLSMGRRPFRRSFAGLVEMTGPRASGPPG